MVGLCPFNGNKSAADKIVKVEIVKKYKLNAAKNKD
jgi:hypothetical protein